MAFSEERGPGIGFWISLALGAVAGGLAMGLGAGWIGFVVVAVVVAIGMLLLLA